MVGDLPDGGGVSERDATRDPDRTSEGDGDGESAMLVLRFQAAGEVVENTLQLSCGDDACVEAEVVIEGGTPPYELRWADGVTGAKREVCAGDGSYGVRVEDSGDPEGEFGTPRLSAEATLSVQRAACSDGGGPDFCRVVTTATKIATCEFSGEQDMYAELGAMLRAGRNYEFRYDLTLLGFGHFGVHASDALCVSAGPELARVEYADGLVIGGAKRTTHTCQTLTQDTSTLFLEQSEVVWGGVVFNAITVCEGCPSEGG